MIDAWAFRPNDGTDKNFEDDATNEQHRRMAVDSVHFARGRGWPIRGLSLEVAGRFAEEVFDWIYIDTKHTYESTLDELVAWYPKVRRGGLVSGDDYGDSQDTEWVTPERFEGSIGKLLGWRTATPTSGKWGTMRAVHEFARSHGHQLFVTWMQDCYHYPAWYFIKA
mmetsp:Transcript_9500/g.23691  ORF Transcript_9500/g.23691 Transcript_9500/m.23691 type:complete len:167 (-) Transcript_9500:78-578(-)